MSVRPHSLLVSTSSEERQQVGKRASSMSNLRVAADIPVVTISPSNLKTNSDYSQAYLYLNMQSSSSNLSIDRGLTASPIPWRDASMEVLVSPNDGPPLSIEDLQLDDSPVGSQDDSPFTEPNDPHQRDGKRAGERCVTRLKSDSSTTPNIDKLIDRRFACYGVSPRLCRKAADADHQTGAAAKAARPSSLNCSSLMARDGNNNS